jgi:hypothetical protein
MIVRIPYHRNNTSAPPMKGAISISQILKEQYNLVHELDYTWYFEPTKKNLVISLNDTHASLSTMISMRFIGVDLYEI